jgi:hypothetical protein
MRRYFGTTGLILMSVAIAGVSLRADVRTEEKTHVSFAGALGRMVNMFGGKAAREGVTQTVAIKGDRRMTTTDRTAQLIDLAEEKVYDIDLDHKSYTVTTFAELRQKMEEAQAKAKERMDKAQSEKAGSGEPQKKMSVDVSTKQTGQRKSINGFDCHEVVTTVTVHEDGKSLEEGGGMVVTSDAWMTGAIPAMKEVQAFNRRYYEKLSGMDLSASRDQMAAAMAMYPALKDALGKVRVEGTRADGTPISTETTVESVPSPEQKEQASAQQQQAPPSGGGLSGMLARRMMKKQQQQEKSQAEGGDSGRSTVMTSTLEVLSVATDVPADAVAVPAGFKEKK